MKIFIDSRSKWGKNYVKEYHLIYNKIVGVCFFGLLFVLGIIFFAPAPLAHHLLVPFYRTHTFICKTQRSQYQLALIYAQRAGGYYQPKKAVATLMALADKNYGPAAYMLGMFYDRGICVARNAKKSEQSLRRAAKNNHRQALVLLVQKYADKKNEHYVRLLEQLADLGDGVAFALLGDLYQARGAIEKSLETYYRGLAYDTTGSVAYALGLFYAQRGRVTIAHKYYRQAIRSGHVIAHYTLAQELAQSPHQDARDYSNFLLKKAAYHGYKPALDLIEA